MAPRKPTPPRGDTSPGCSSVIIAGAALVVGIVAAGMVGQRLLRDLRAEVHWTETRCTIESRQVATTVDGDGERTYRPEFIFSHQREGRTYRARGFDHWGTESSDGSRARAIVERFEVGQRYPCWFDPANPGQAVLVRGGGWQRVWGLFPLPFILIGCVTLLGGIRKRLEPVKVAVAPWLPMFRLARGRTRAVTLLSRESEREALEGIVFVMALWNSLTFVAGGLLWDDFLESGSWTKILFLVPFALTAGVLIYLSVRQLLIFLRVPETHLELSHAPLCPGDAFELSLVQTGRFRLEELRIQLLCEERVEYAEGTDTRTERVVVLDELLARVPGAEVRRERPFVINRIRGVVPGDAMHTFQSKHNDVEWKLVVKGAIASWPDFEREYVLPVLPRELEATFRERLAWEKRPHE
jgi:hypothetical protein